MKRRAFLVAFLLLVLSVFAASSFGTKMDVPQFNLSGVWKGNDGGKYHIRQLNDELWWFGESSPTNPAWSNVAHGLIRNREIVLKWADVPKGSIMNSGELMLEVVSENRIVAKSKTGGFGGSEWTREGTAAGGAGTLPGPTGRSYTAQPRGPGDQVTVVAYGHDESDGSDVGWNAQYPNPSFDDDPGRRGLPNAKWQGSHWWNGDRLCLGIKNLEAPHPPAHTLSVGYTVTLPSGTFEDGAQTKTFVLYRYSGAPAKKEITECYRVVTGAPAPSQAGLLETLEVPNTKPVKVLSRTVLEAGREYIVEASGTFDDWGNTPHGVDAVWCFAEWRCGKKGEVWDQLRINDKGMTELAGQSIPYNPNHVYQVRIKGQGKPAELYMSDAQGSWTDNLGGTTVRIYAAGTPGAPTGQSFTAQPRATEDQPQGRSYTAQPRKGSTEDVIKQQMIDTLQKLFGR